MPRAEPHAGYLALMVVLHFPAPGQLQLLVGEHVEKSHKVPVVLVAFKVVGVPPDFGDHVLQTRVVCKHAVGTLEKGWRTKVNPGDRQEPHGHKLSAPCAHGCVLAASLQSSSRPTHSRADTEECILIKIL